MSPSAEVYSRFKEPSNFDSDYASDHDFHRFPQKHVDTNDDGPYTSSGGGDRGYPRSQHYADSEPESRFGPGSRLASRSRTERSRKTSSSKTSTARELVRALLHERLSTDSNANTEAQLARAYDIIREESRRAADAERTAIETTQRLKGLAISRAQAQKDAAQAQAELRAYKLQLENAQRQLEEANAIAAASDAERLRAEEAAIKLKRAVQKLRLGDEVKRAREQGIREGLQESGYGYGYGVVPSRPRTSPRDRGPLIEDEDDLEYEEVPITPTSNVPLPVPPPASVPVMSRRSVPTTPTLRRVQTPVSAYRDSGYQGTSRETPVPEVIRQRETPPSRRSQTPALPILSRRAETPRQPEYESFDPQPETREMPMHINPVPDHIIIRSPVPIHPSPQDQMSPVPQQIHPARVSHPLQDPRSQHRARHYSLSDPAARASASASRIYSNYSTSSSSSATPPPTQRPPSRILRRREDLPEQETIVPRPPSTSAQQFSPPARPPSASDSIPMSAAALARNQQRQRPRPGHRHASSSSTSSSSVTAFPTPSAIARLQRLPLGERSWSAESGSSVPGITIEPPSRPDSVDSNATGVTLPSHMSPFVGTAPSPSVPHSIPGWGTPGVSVGGPQAQPQLQRRGTGPIPPRPPSRTGFMYGPPDPGVSGISQAPNPTDFGPRMAAPGPAAGTIGFTSPLSPSVTPRMTNFAAPGSAGGPVISGAADYFAGDHRSHHAPDPSRGHRREPARMGDSVDSLGRVPVPDPNTFHDPDTDPSLSSSSDDRAPTPRASGSGIPNPYVFEFDERRAGFDDRRGAATPTSMAGGFVPPRPPSSTGSARAMEDFHGPTGYTSPRGVPLPASTSTSAYASRAASDGPPGSGNGNGKGGRTRKTSFASGKHGTRLTSRTAYGNTPFVRSNSLYDD